MIFKSSAAAVAAAICMCAAISPPSASAAIMQAIYTGHVYGGIDTVGAFAPVGTDLAGQAFEEFFEYDTSVGFVNDVGSGFELLGGPEFGQPVNILDAWALIRGVKHHFSAAAASLISVHGDQVNHLVWGPYPPVNGGSLMQGALFPLSGGPTSLDQEFHASGFALNGGGVIQVLGGPVPGDPATVLQIVTETVDITRVADVPEPGTWALVVAGFGLLGLTLRCRRAPHLATSRG